MSVAAVTMGLSYLVACGTAENIFHNAKALILAKVLQIINSPHTTHETAKNAVIFHLHTHYSLFPQLQQSFQQFLYTGNVFYKDCSFICSV